MKYAEKSPNAIYTKLGATTEGRELPLLIFADPPVKTPAEAARSGKLVVLAIGNIHGGEVCRRADLEAATDRSAQPWVSGRAHADLARLALRSGDRTAARAFAVRSESLCREGNDPACVSDARQLLRRSGGG